MKKKVYKISKWFHKYLGLVLILFLIWESLSGILMNHPELISSISVSKMVSPFSLSYKKIGIEVH